MNVFGYNFLLFEVMAQLTLIELLATLALFCNSIAKKIGGDSTHQIVEKKKKMNGWRCGCGIIGKNKGPILHEKGEDRGQKRMKKIGIYP